MNTIYTLTLMPKKCSECIYWDNKNGWPAGECHRYPPSDRGGWARSGPDDWCGEFEQQRNRPDPTA